MGQNLKGDRQKVESSELWARVLLAISQTGSKRGAAAMLGLDARAISNIISDIESHSRKSLFREGVRTTTLTENGKKFIPQASYIVKCSEEFAGALRQNDVVPNKSIKINVPIGIWSYHIHPAMKGIMKSWHPFYENQKLIKEMKSRDISLSFTTSSDFDIKIEWASCNGVSELSDDFKIKRISRIPLVIFSGNPPDEFVGVELADLIKKRKVTLIVYEGYKNHESLSDWQRLTDLAHPEDVMTTPDLFSILPMLEAGICLTLMPIFSQLFYNGISPIHGQKITNHLDLCFFSHKSLLADANIRFAFDALYELLNSKSWASWTYAGGG